MERTVLHVAIDSFPIQAERLRCPRLLGRPIALATEGSQRPRVLVASREARAAGVRAGTPLVAARRLCRDLVALPVDRGLYAGVGEAILGRLSPLAPVVEPAGGGPGGAAGGGSFFLDLTGVARTPPGAREHAARAGREIEEAFGLHAALGLAVNKLVSRVASRVVAPRGDLLDVSCGSEPAFLAPLPVRVLPAAREEAARLDLLNVRRVRDLQALSPAQLAAVFGRAGGLLWRQARGVDPSPVRPCDTGPRVVAEETLSRETNDSRALLAHVARLALEVGAGLRGRGEGARSLALMVEYADGRSAVARRTFDRALAGRGELHAAAAALLSRAVARRVRVRRLRLEARGIQRGPGQLSLWETGGGRPGALESALDRVRARFGTEALVPASWILHGLAVRPPARP